MGEVEKPKVGETAKEASTQFSEALKALDKLYKEIPTKKAPSKKAPVSEESKVTSAGKEGTFYIQAEKTDGTFWLKSNSINPAELHAVTIDTSGPWHETKNTYGNHNVCYAPKKKKAKLTKSNGGNHINNMTNHDPIKNYEILMGKIATTNKVEALELSDVPKAHQTLIVIHASKYSAENARERIVRFTTSLNLSNTIKADVVTIADGKMYAGVYFGGTKAGGKEIEEFNSYAHYVQICTLKDNHL